MSQTVQDAEAAVAAVAAALGKTIPIIETVASMLAPGSGAAIAMAASIAKGVLNEAPEAEALWDAFSSGTTPPQAQLDAYAASEQAAYEKLMADIKAKQTQQ